MVIASGGTGSEGYLSSTEIWDPMSEDGWILGNKLNRMVVRMIGPFYKFSIRMTC